MAVRSVGTCLLVKEMATLNGAAYGRGGGHGGVAEGPGRVRLKGGGRGRARVGGVEGRGSRKGPGGWG